MFCFSSDKPKTSSQPNDTPTKKLLSEGPVPPPQIPTIGGYGMYPMYPNISPYGYPPDHPHAPNKGLPGSQLPSVGGPPPSLGSRVEGKEPPLDLMNKPSANDPNAPPQSASKELPPQVIPQPNPSKGLPTHYYPYGRSVPQIVSTL